MEKSDVTKDSLSGNQAKQILSTFFSDVILSDYLGDNKAAAVNTLLTSFHQGGLLHPVSAGMAHTLHGEGFGASASDSPKQVNIQTNKKGFVVQEVYTVKKCNLEITASEELQAKFEDWVIEPDNGNDYVLQAQATINVSFKNDGSLNTKVINQGISYGSEYVEEIADQRNWLSKLIDLLKNIFGQNSVENLAEPDEVDRSRSDVDIPTPR